MISYHYLIETHAVRTIGRIMALNRLVYDDIPHVPKRGVKRIPGPHPYKASHRHQYWFIDGRQLDFRVDGVKWWSLIILEGYSRGTHNIRTETVANVLHV